MSNKIGLKIYNKDLFSKFLNNMVFDKVDYINFFRLFSNLKVILEILDDDLIVLLKNVFFDLSKERRKVWFDWLY